MTSKGDALFDYNQKDIDAIYKSKKWQKDPRYMKHCKISALAGMKMLKHATAGVVKGKKTKGFPVEVMGLLVGRPEGNTMIVTDVIPLPVEGEAAFVQAQGKVQLYIVNIMESLEKLRKEAFVGWYHSHPFDVGAFPCWFMSNTDLQTQTAFQMSSPLWTAIVIDPLRSIAKQEPSLGVFRAFKPGVPDSKLMPNGERPPSEEAAEERWHSWKRYYCLKHSFFMSSLSINFLKIMSRNSLWIRALATQNVMDKDYREGVSNRIERSVQDLSKHSHASGRGMERKGRSQIQKSNPYSVAARACCELASEQCLGHACTVAKQLIFNIIKLQEERRAKLTSSSSSSS